jgi:hypothetical protein
MFQRAVVGHNGATVGTASAAGEGKNSLEMAKKRIIWPDMALIAQFRPGRLDQSLLRGVALGLQF